MVGRALPRREALGPLRDLRPGQHRTRRTRPRPADAERADRRARGRPVDATTAARVRVRRGRPGHAPDGAGPPRRQTGAARAPRRRHAGTAGHAGRRELPRHRRPGRARAARCALAGRPGRAPPRADRSAPARKRGAAGDRGSDTQGVMVSVRQIDAGDTVAMTALVDELARSTAPLRGVIHAAGQLEDGALLGLHASRLGAALRGKAEGARVLDALTRRLPLDFFVLYSAAGVLLGPAGQGAYAAANAALDAVAQARSRAGLPATSVAWGLWGEGMAAGAGRAGWASRGLGTITAPGGMARLERLLREAAVSVAVLPIDWPRFLSGLPGGVDRSFFAGLAPRKSTPPRSSAAAGGGLAARWRELRPGERRDAMLEDLSRQAVQVLGLGADTLLDARRPLKEVGLDSLMAVELRNQLARAVDAALPATLLFDYPTLEALAAFLVQRLELSPAEALPAAGGERRAVASMSDEEAEALLLAELDDRDDGKRS
ncbi:KR domain-containing protein [Piscinibacter aquaticus]|uniref:KR domain-containing protein n=1 Tax=Piscinibacter aquaticus TaxID=392597 RepID=A0A5C6U314_9BURK|nr:KR domain-containing protein [Piscinibacter aquaticus]